MSRDSAFATSGLCLVCRGRIAWFVHFLEGHGNPCSWNNRNGLYSLSSIFFKWDSNAHSCSISRNIFLLFLASQKCRTWAPSPEWFLENLRKFLGLGGPKPETSLSIDRLSKVLFHFLDLTVNKSIPGRGIGIVLCNCKITFQCYCQLWYHTHKLRWLFFFEEELKCVWPYISRKFMLGVGCVRKPSLRRGVFEDNWHCSLRNSYTSYSLTQKFHLLDFIFEAC